MPVYRIHRTRDHVRQHFRNSAQTLGAGNIKPRDYVAEDGVREASSPYAVWQELLSTDRRIDIGDVLESDAGLLYICKYVGFEEARWVVPQSSDAAASDAPAAGGEELAPAGA
jgi:hypothetical protein